MLKDTLRVWHRHFRRASLESGKPALRQLLEIVAWRFRGFSALEYYIYPLYVGHPGPRVTTRDYDALQSRLNPPARGVIGVDKWVQAAIWHSHGIRHARVLGYVWDGHGMLGEKPFTGQTTDLTRFLQGAVFPLVLKPLDGANGRGFDIVESFSQPEQTVCLRSAGVLSLADFQNRYCNAQQGTLFQEYVVQHPALASIYSASLNTVRLVTQRTREGCVVRQAMIKFGSGGDIIDNDLNSGVIVDIELETGRLQRAVRRLGSEVLYRHPDSGYVFEECVVPDWEEVKQLAVRAHHALPTPGYLGWDVALAGDGPLVIEVNAYLSVAVNQKVSGRMAEGLLDD